MEEGLTSLWCLLSVCTRLYSCAHLGMRVWQPLSFSTALHLRVFFVFVFLRQDLSPNQEIASTVILAILQAPRSSFSLPPSAGMTGASHGQLLCGC